MIKEIQEEVKQRLEECEELAALDATVVCADDLDVVNKVEQTLATRKGILVLVAFPEIERDGCNGECIPCRATLAVQCVELPALRKARACAATAAEAAAVVALALDGPKYNFVSIRQTSDPTTATLTATATFNTSLSLVP